MAAQSQSKLAPVKNDEDPYKSFQNFLKTANEEHSRSLKSVQMTKSMEKDMSRSRISTQGEQSRMQEGSLFKKPSNDRSTSLGGIR